MPLQLPDISRIIKSLIPETLSTKVYVKPATNGYNIIELVNKKVNYTTAYSIHDIIDETILKDIDCYIERVQSMEYLQDIVNTLKTTDTTIKYDHDFYHNRLDFMRSHDSRHYALIQTEKYLALVWMANIQTIDKEPLTGDIVLKQWPNNLRKRDIIKTFKQALDDTQSKKLEELTIIQ
jgi:hypothetical protein